MTKTGFQNKKNIHCSLRKTNHVKINSKSMNFSLPHILVSHELRSCIKCRTELYVLNILKI